MLYKENLLHTLFQRGMISLLLEEPVGDYTPEAFSSKKEDISSLALITANEE